MRRFLPCLLLSALVQAQQPTAPTTIDYQPLAVPEQAAPTTLLLSVDDAAHHRELPVRVFLPSHAAPAPIILFSHGLGGNRDTCNYLGEHWSRRGYVVVFVQHPGSDDSVWKGLPVGEIMQAMQRAANVQNLVLRCQDIGAVLDQLAIWNAAAEHACHGRFDLEHIGMSGHSFGAMTTQFVTGEQGALSGQKFTDPRLDAALVLSPSSPRAGDPARALAKVRVPWFCMTGTDDVSPIGDQDAASRQLVYANLPSTLERYELVLDGATHGAFTERSRPGEQPRKASHHRSILALSTAFWDATLRDDAAARAWLRGDGAKSTLDAADRWSVGRLAPLGSSRGPVLR